jgi:hypothetical protein
MVYQVSTGDDPVYMIEVYKAARDFEFYLMIHVIPGATERFSVSVHLPGDGASLFIDYFNSLTKYYDEYTEHWITEDLVRDIHNWFKTVVPQYSRAFMTDKDVTELAPFHISEGENVQNVDEKLRSRDDYILAVYPTQSQSFLLSRKGLADENFINKSTRFGCKTQNSLNPTNILDSMPLVDIRQGGAHVMNVVVTLDGLKAALSMGGRVFCLFPSFDRFVGLKSTASNMDSALHCAPDSGAIYRTFGITRCPGETTVSMAGETCYSDEDYYRTRKPNGCGDTAGPYSYAEKEGVEGCCEMEIRRATHNGERGFTRAMRTIMNIYGGRTVERSEESMTAVQEAYEWYTSQDPLDSEIIIGTEGDMFAYRMYRDFKPVSKKLVIHVDETTRPEFVGSIMSLKRPSGGVLCDEVEFRLSPIGLGAHVAIAGFFKFPAPIKTSAFSAEVFENGDALHVIDSIDSENRRFVLEFASFQIGHVTKLAMFLVDNGFKLGRDRTRSRVQLERGHVLLRLEKRVADRMVIEMNFMTRFDPGAARIGEGNNKRRKP